MTIQELNLSAEKTQRIIVACLGTNSSGYHVVEDHTGQVLVKTTYPMKKREFYKLHGNLIKDAAKKEVFEPSLVIPLLHFDYALYVKAQRLITRVAT